MLKELTIENYRSINKELFFSMEADTERVSEYPNHISKKTNNNLLKVASMYGPNGGGKTNIIGALRFPATVCFFNNQQTSTYPNKIACEFSGSPIIKETVFYVTKNYEIGYSFDVKQNIRINENMQLNGQKTINFKNSFEFERESVVYRKKDEKDYILLLERNENGTVESESLKKDGICINQTLTKNLSSLKYLYDTYSNTNCIEMKVIHELAEELLGVYNLEVSPSIIVNFDFISDELSKHKEKIVKLLNDVDIKINDIVIDKKDMFSPISFERIVDIDGNKIKKHLSLSEESAGTQKIFWMFFNLLIDMENGHIFYCDDLNAYLHPKLYRSIIEIFTSKENENNQLIFNSHDILNMTNELFRRDEIWFVYRDDNYSSTATPLSNMINYKGQQIRKDAKYYKQYIEGKYGADPFIKKGLLWND